MNLVHCGPHYINFMCDFMYCKERVWLSYTGTAEIWLPTLEEETEYEAKPQFVFFFFKVASSLEV